MKHMETKRLKRSYHDRVIGGVAGGIAEYFSIDSVIVRILFLASGIFGGGILIYLICLIMMPQDYPVNNNPK